MSSITIKHPSMSAEELKTRLNKITSPETLLEFNIENSEEKRSGLDATVLVAIISGSVTVLTALITGILALAKEKNNRTITIQTKEGNRYQIPITATEKEVGEYILKVENNQLKSITVNN